MIFEKTNLVYFSATGTTAKIVHAIESGIGSKERCSYKLIDCIQDTVTIPDNEIVVFGVPVFSGRVPAIAKNALDKIKGSNTPAIIACVYGNRDFDDALLELKDIVERNGFYVVSAGAFVAQHSIFPQVAQGRPDTSDLAKAKEFGASGATRASLSFAGTTFDVKGNRPYRAIKRIPLNPRTSRKCDSCGVCTKQCPMQAIDLCSPKKIDKNKCISCARCIAVCPKRAKKFGGLLYRLVSRKFVKNCSQRQEPYLVYR